MTENKKVELNTKTEQKCNWNKAIKPYTFIINAKTFFNSQKII